MPEYPQRGLRQMEPNVPEWAGRYPNVYGLAGATREMIQPFMRGGLADVALSRAVGYPTPEFMTEREQMGLPISGGLFSKAAPIARPQIWVKQHPSGGFVAQSGVGRESGFITSGKTLEETMQKAKVMSPGYDIKVLKESPLEVSKRILGSERGSFSTKPLEKKSPLTERFAVSKVPPEELAKANADPSYSPLEKIIGYVEASGEGEAQKLINQYHPSAMLSDRAEDIAVASKMGDLGLSKAPQPKAIDVPFRETGGQKELSSFTKAEALAELKRRKLLK